MTKHQITDVLQQLGFKLEYDQLHVKGKGWARFRHKFGPEHEKEFALIIYGEYSNAAIFESAAEMLIKIGKWQKTQQLLHF